MNVDEYDTKGTAEMVGKVIMETLGLSREEIKSCIHHFSYDGVYATNEERQTGGGLKLRDQFAVWLGLEKGAITGNHDLAHNLQLAFGETLGSDKSYKKNTEIMYRAMSEHKSGKEKNAFEQFARQRSWAVLEQKSRQTTRFVRSDLRAFQGYLRNLPALCAIHCKRQLEFSNECNNTLAKDEEQKVKSLSNGN